ncbi:MULTISPECIES: EamA family transporter [unclassified Rhizobium]|uniref:EamA family transporter n=1 Tax=unclassified Rhizobium TaxID=2613769 RepID=UPI0007E98A27|nr:MULTISPECIES: EamA family transporter [unclassified Rhizobium]ANM10937.1 DMT superfamily inner membrane transporter protein [Rhizobium sp. N324]ANM17479.1 DMT superfamily inner membrane transporter protein [Rhizobium sp. N541]ANM23864.1 DMT superfamily inner membrane transporter protein [Rhizobium sp. N941]OYD04538.1 DMT superfamily inner membrane transporter protein [Rhizobium sp. N4311]
MNSLWPIVIGGILPAIFWGITAIFQKQSATSATGSAVYLIAFGAACALAGLIAALIWRPAPWTVEGLGFAATAGACFAIGTGLISFALFAYGVPVAKLAPIWSCNVLVTLAIAALLLGEASDLDVVRLAAGTLLIISGALLVSSA